MVIMLIYIKINCNEKISNVLLFYRIITSLLLPLFFLYGYYRAYARKDQIGTTDMRFGVYKKHKKQKNVSKIIAFYAVSLGEVKSLSTLIPLLCEKDDHILILLMVTTNSAWLEAKKMEETSSRIIAILTPFDHPLFVKRFLSFWNPSIGVFVESECWPNMICAMHDNAINVVRLNARMSVASYKKLRFLKPLCKKLNQKIHHQFAQSEQDKIRLMKCGFTRVYCKGNIKYANRNNTIEMDEYRHWWDILKEKKIMIASSTHEGEEEKIIDIYKKICKVHLIDILVIIPRHIERYKNIVDLVRKENMDYHVTKLDRAYHDEKVIIVNEWGKSNLWYKIGGVVLMGGAWRHQGGHNPLEAFLQNTFVISGSACHNFKSLYEIACAKNIAYIHDNNEDIVNFVVENYEKISHLPSSLFQEVEEEVTPDIHHIVKVIYDST